MLCAETSVLFFKMDKQLIQVLDQLPDLQTNLSRLQMASKGAQESHQSALRLQQTGHEKLCAARMKRCETLLVHLRTELQCCCKTVDKMVTVCNEPLDKESGMKKHKQNGSWNKLPDSWWEQRLNQVTDKLNIIQNGLAKVEEQVDAQFGTYEEIVDGIHQQVVTVVVEMHHLGSYIEQWEQLARIVAGGVGESIAFVTRNI